MFQDEARFGRINNLKKCWAPKGIRPEIKSQVVREYTYAYGAFSPKDGTCDFLILPFMNLRCMNIFLQELSNRHNGELIMLICDGASCHKKESLQIPDNIILKTLPPYCPEVNPSENMWDEIREKFFPNIFFDSMDFVEDRLIEACLFYENKPEIVKSITGFNWIIPSL